MGHIGAPGREVYAGRWADVGRENDEMIVEPGSAPGFFDEEDNEALDSLGWYLRGTTEQQITARLGVHILLPDKLEHHTEPPLEIINDIGGTNI